MSTGEGRGPCHLGSREPADVCGFIAMLSADGVRPDRAAIERGALRMEARGPDDSGFWEGPGVAMAHRRLAILDLDHRAAQPMHSHDDRYVVVFNGEIYNFVELRQRLLDDGMAFRTTSDTEVLLALFERHGPAMLPFLRGMFSFLIWDKATRQGFVARDPYGIKPLYFADTPDGVIFGSQVKALLASGLVSHETDPLGQAGFWLFGSVPEPLTWFSGIKAIEAGHCATIVGGHVRTGWCWHDVRRAWLSRPGCRLPDDEVQDVVRSALLQSVRAHLVSDVPVGIFLSGGIDSGALAGLMVDAGAMHLQGVTIAYDEFAGTRQDESIDAGLLAAHYGIRHSIRKVERREFEDDLPAIMRAMDQPSIDGVNTWFASKAVAERGLKVVISGVGGDELFQGYSNFRRLPRAVASWRRLARIPGILPLAQAAADSLARKKAKPRWSTLPAFMDSLPGAWWCARGLFAPDELRGVMQHDVPLAAGDPRAWAASMAGPLPSDPKLGVGLIETVTYLRNQLLRDSDWASMGHSVELRTPLVDAWLLQQVAPILSEFSRFQGKKLLAEAPKRPLPKAIAHRRKTGFGIPMLQWRQGACTRWARRVAEGYMGSLP